MLRAKNLPAPAAHSARSLRPLMVLTALLLVTAFTVPTNAQVETVVVTAERKAENIQTVPVAVTALTAQDLKAKQVTNFRDLQFHVPSVTYTKSNFGGAQFQIRGITTQFGLGAAISQNLDDIYLEAPNLVTGEYYDVDRVEVARGPQSTSYGRAATGGSVNIITTKPDLDNFSARASVDYGSFDTYKPDAAINIPIIDGELAVRFAIHGDYHDGYERNIYPGPQIFPGRAPEAHINSLGTTDARFSARWQPSDDTTIDLVADAGYENDTRVRGDKQECHRDPSGVIGCLPDRLGFDPINVNSTLGTTLGSAQGIADTLTGPLVAAFGTANGVALAQTIGNTVGLCTLAGNGASNDPAHGAGAAFLGVRESGASLVPQTPEEANGPCSGANGLVTPDILTTNTAFNPKYKTAGGTYLLNWQQKVTDWLAATVDAGYADGYQFTQQDYNDQTHENISPQISQAVSGFNEVFGSVVQPVPAIGILFNHQAPSYDAAYFNQPGQLPLSNTNYLGPGFRNYGGIIDNTRGGIFLKTPFNVAYDEDWFGQREITGEARFQTKFSGPLNFSAGAFFLNYTSHNQYWVAANGLDYEALVLGAASDPRCPAPCTTSVGPTGLVLGLPTFDSEYRRQNITNRSAFLEATWEILPDELKLIAGARFNDDREHLLRTPPAVGGGLLTTGLFPIGATNVTLPVNAIDPGPVVIPGSKKTVDTTDLWTGRVSLNWTPALDFTDQTLVYATFSRGELAGGTNVVNNGAVPDAAGFYPGGIPAFFKPATVDSIEVGEKSTLLDNTLTANLTVWYYNYENYQVGIISNRQALTLNIPARLYGLEGEFLWQPTEDLAFNLSVSLTGSEAGNAFLVDQRNPTNNQPGTILIKDVGNGALCTVQVQPGNPKGLPVSATPGDSAAYHVSTFYLPNGGDAAIDAASGVPLVNYGLCPPTGPGDSSRVFAQQQLQAAGFQYTQDVDPRTGLPTDTFGSGIARNLHGSRLPQVPLGQVGVGAQYTFKLDGGYSFVPRADYYYQSSYESRVWNDPVIDHVNGWDVANVNLQLNAPDNKWYAALFAKNLFDKKNPTGTYLTDPTSALYTNVFAEDPRVVGISLGASW